jgi:hypothetical protein
MAVAYVPSFLEDRATFVKERANGLYGSAAFIISNFIIGLPYLCEFSNVLVGLQDSVYLRRLNDEQYFKLKSKMKAFFSFLCFCWINNRESATVSH